MDAGVARFGKDAGVARLRWMLALHILGLTCFQGGRRVGVCAAHFNVDAGVAHIGGTPVLHILGLVPCVGGRRRYTLQVDAGGAQ